MENYYKNNVEHNQFSSRFSIENILKKDVDILKKPLSSSENSYHEDDLCESWRREDFSCRKTSENFYNALYQYRHHDETEHWLKRNHFQRPRSLPLLTSAYSSPLSPYSTDVEVIPSPSPTSSSWSPSEIFNRQTMESWFMSRAPRSPTHFSHYPRRRSPDRGSPYSRSWNSSLSSEREGYTTHLLKPTFISTTTDDEIDDGNRKGGQVRFSHTQSSELERVFSIQKYISPQERKQLSRTLDLTERQVKTWFQNRRAKWRRIKLEDEMRVRMTENCLTRLTDDHGNESARDRDLFDSIN